MVNSTSEKRHMRKIRTFIYLSMSLLFSMIFILVSMFLLYFPMVSLLDFAYFPPKLAIGSFLAALVFSILAIKNPFGKILIAVNVVFILFMIFQGV